MGRAAAREEPIPRSPVETAKPRGDAGVQMQFEPPDVQAEGEVIEEADDIPIGIVPAASRDAASGGLSGVTPSEDSEALLWKL